MVFRWDFKKMNMKITLISYDYFGYDFQIVAELQKQGHIATHIDINKFEFVYKNVFQRILNFFLKNFLNKNLKQIKLKKYIFEQLNHIGFQDKILVIRPDLISKKTHLLIKKQTNCYICYLYDSAKRFKISHLTTNVFDDVFSYDFEDAENFGFKKISNFMVFDKFEIKSKFQNQVFMIMSPDERLQILNKIVERLDLLQIKTNCIVVSSEKPLQLNSKIIHHTKKISQKEAFEMLYESEIFLDLNRNNHNGLSFRVFEAMALQRKVITTNQAILKYDFYNPNNILVLDENNIKIEAEFFETNYVALSNAIFEKYTVENWTKTVFKI